MDPSPGLVRSSTFKNLFLIEQNRILRLDVRELMHNKLSTYVFIYL